MIPAVKNHPQSFEQNRYVYAVVSRRSHGLSIGINMNPDKFCNFDCVYCQVDRTTPGIDAKIDLRLLEKELRDMLDLYRSGELKKHASFEDTPDELLQLHDVALSGDGEPTLCKDFAAVCECVDRIRREPGQPPFEVVLITNATGLHLPEVRQGLSFFSDQDEIWAKLDAGTDAYLRTIDRTGVKLELILENIVAIGQRRPVIIQTLLLEHRRQGPSDQEIDAYLQRLSWLKDQGCRIKLVQVYSIARPPADADARPLDRSTLEAIADRIERLGLKAEVF